MNNKTNLTRRAFLRASALAAMGLTAGCTSPIEPASTGTATEPAAQVQPTATPTAAPTQTPAATQTTPPTATMEPSSTPTATATATQHPPTQTPQPPATTTAAHTPVPIVAVPGRADLMAHYPQVGQSVVSVVRHDGVWDGDQIQSLVVLQMLDAAIVELTGLDDAMSAWRALFDPGEVIGLKVNTISRYTTTPQTAMAVVQRLQDIGVPAEQIVIFDRSHSELKTQGFPFNNGGPGVQCRGAKAWDQQTTVSGTTQRVHDVMLSCSALINIPALKEHGTSGFTSALKNHYGTIDSPGALHGNHCDPYIPDLNALPVIRDKTRLIVGDWIRTCPYDWNRMTKENTIAMSFDPVAHDHVARQMLIDRRNADGRPGQYIEAKSHYLSTAIDAGLGAGDEHSEVRQVVLS